jgi:solute carrier family 25 carnitine/acylcarnitine transporter 20/29
VNYLAGVCGGVSVVLVGHPFDTTKTRMQTAPKGFYSSTLDTIKQTWKFEGIKGFYSGMTSPLLGQMFFRAASFMTFYSSIDAISEYRNETKASASTTVTAGAITGLIISFIETPIDLIKTKLQIQIFRDRLQPEKQRRYSTFRGCVSFILKRHGSIALYQGMQATMIRNMPANAMFFPVNELMKEHMAQEQGVRVSELPMGKKLTAGAIAGLCYWTLTYPLDAVKGRIMAESWKHRSRYIDVVRKMNRRPTDYLVGIVPSAARGAVACAAMFYTVDVCRNAFVEMPYWK